MSANKRIRVHTQERVYTRDARSRDTRLSAEVTPLNGQMMGRQWVGNFLAQFDKLSATDRRAAIDEVKRGLANYGNEVGSGLSSGTMGPGPFGSLATDRPEMEFSFGTPTTPETLQRTNDAYWRDRLGQPVAPRMNPLRRGTPATAADVQAVNAAFWAAQATYQGREWGKG